MGALRSRDEPGRAGGMAMSEQDPWEPDWEGAPPKDSGRRDAPGPSATRIFTPRRPLRPGLLSSLLSILPPLLAFATLLGLGLRQETTAWLAALGAALAVGLPVLGLSSLLRHQPLAVLAAMWIWPLALLLGLPGWVPGQRTASLAEGLAWLAQPAGEGSSERARELGTHLGQLLGPGELPAATPVDQPPPVEPSSPSTAQAPPPTPSVPPSDDTAIVLSYEGEAHSLRVPITADGPTASEELWVLFDTGATFTTLDRGVLQRLGVRVPADAPTARFQTANGEIESPLVLLDRVWLGDRAIEGVTVAVCDDCSGPRTAGLLGLNVTRNFEATLDHEIQEIALRHSGSADRHLDVTHWLDIEVRGIRRPPGPVVMSIDAGNRASRGVSEAVVEIECSDGSFAAQLDDIPPGGKKSTSFELPSETSCDSYRAVLRTARW